MDKSVYMTALDELSRTFEAVPNTAMAAHFKTVTLAVMNMRYEKIAFNRSLPEHPYVMVKRLIEEQHAAFKACAEVLFIENPATARLPGGKKAQMEPKHQDLFNAIWNQYDPPAYETYVDRYKHRVRVNALEPLIRGKKCLDLGCGNGNFCFALADLGAALAAGIDFGAESIAFADKKRAERKGPGALEFKVNNVYELDYPDAHFDFLIQNGVFHHLDDEMKAIREARRVVKKGGWFWYYTDGEGGISYDLWDRSVHLLRELPIDFMRAVLRGLNVSVPKLAHLMDGMNAVYRHTSWKKATAQLAEAGFGNFRRLTGGFDTDFDLDVIEKDPYGREKFGEGDLRILAQRID